MAMTKLYSVEDLLEMDDDGCRHEIVRGELRTMPPTNDEYGSLMLHLSALLWNYQQAHPEIRCFAGDPGFVLARDPDSLVGPDLAAVRVDRLPAEFPRRSFFDIAPDFVIEILSPSERVGQINDKVNAYLSADVRMIWLVNPATRSVTVHRPEQHTQILEGSDILDGDDVLPEFNLVVADLFG